jgi:hypothetical protein
MSVVKPSCYGSCEDRGHAWENFKDCPNACGAVLECGGHCCLDKGHTIACECIGDEPGKPGTCPA